MIKEISVVLPVYNESEIIAKVLDEVLSFVRKRFDKYEIVVVDDGSIDNSGRIIKNLCQSNGHINLVTHENNRGYGAAIRTGLKTACLDYICFMDADAQFRIEDIDSLLPYIDDYHIVIGYREKRKDPLYRVFLGKIFTIFFNFYLNTHFRDINCGYKLFKRNCLKGMSLKLNGPLINTEILIASKKMGLKIKECSVPHYPRASGQQTGAKISTIFKAFKDFFCMLFKIH
ncbi:MAG: glycosyltransferase family 2 protein [Candidatus Omnitrophica bacterium]|nr:glycosyltransferase family 2 protein [Candidatus Omnitrophota bacterium]